MAVRSSTSYHSKGRRKHRPVLLVSGDKGGTGKSFVARAIAGWLKSAGYAVRGFDGDARNPHLERYYGASMPVSQELLRSADGWAEMYQAWEDAHASEVLIVDLPGNIGDMVEEECKRLPLVAERFDRTVINVWVANEEEDSIWLLQRALGLTTPQFTIFVMNGRFGATPAQFELWQTSKTREAFLADGGVETLLPLLPIHPRTKIMSSRSPFDDVSAAGLTITETIDFAMWWERVEHALQPLAKMMEAA